MTCPQCKSDELVYVLWWTEKVTCPTCGYFGKAEEMGGKGSGTWDRKKKNLPCKWHTLYKCYAMKCIDPEKLCPAKDDAGNPRYGKNWGKR